MKIRDKIKRKIVTDRSMKLKTKCMKLSLLGRHSKRNYISGVHLKLVWNNLKIKKNEGLSLRKCFLG